MLDNDFISKVKAVIYGYATFPEFKKTPPSKNESDDKTFYAYLNKDNALGALKVVTYLAFSIPLGIGYGLNYGFNTLKNKLETLKNYDIKGLNKKQNPTNKAVEILLDKEIPSYSSTDSEKSIESDGSLGASETASYSSDAEGNTSPDPDELADDAKSIGSDEG